MSTEPKTRRCLDSNATNGSKAAYRSGPHPLSIRHSPSSATEVTVRFAHWQEVPAGFAGAVARRGKWWRQMFEVVEPMQNEKCKMKNGGPTAGSVVTLDSLMADGFVPKLEVVRNDFSEFDLNLMLSAVASFYLEGEFDEALKVNESLSHHLRILSLETRADAEGVLGS